MPRPVLIGLLVLALAAIVAAVLAWRRRAKARRWLETMAANLGFGRKHRETDEELRARISGTLRGVGRFTRKDLEILVKEAFWLHGYRRIELEFSEPDFGHVRAHAKGAIPAPALRAVEEELRDRLPVTLYLELTAEPA